MTLAAPHLTRRGRALLAGALALLFVGATSGQILAAAGGASMLGLLAVALLGTRAAVTAARRLSVQLELPDGPTRGRRVPMALALRLTHSGDRPLRDLRLRLVSSGEAEPLAWVLDVPPHAEAVSREAVAFPRAGHWRTLGLEVRLAGLLGLAAARHYLPLEQSLSVRPSRIPDARLERVLARVGALRDREGRHLDRAVGSGLELRELRDYVPGDPLKIIAWKATARRQRPLVRAFEEETVRRLQVLLDIGPTMRAGDLGATPLDQAVDLTATLAERCVGDRLGLTTFDHRVYGHLRPESGRAHLQRLLHHLMDLSRVVDEDLTEISDAELVARVGDFLERQEGVAVRRLGEDPARARVARTLIDPLRELFDEAAIFTAVTTYLAEDRDRGHANLFAKARPAENLLSARLRLFCALRGLPLPYRLTGPPDSQERGVVAAVSRNLVAGGPDTLVLISDLRGVSAGGAAVRALRLAKAHKRRLVVVQVGARSPAAELGEALRATGATFVHEVGASGS